MDDGVCHWSLHGFGEQAGHEGVAGQRSGVGQRSRSSLTNKLFVVTGTALSFFLFLFLINNLTLFLYFSFSFTL